MPACSAVAASAEPVTRSSSARDLSASLDKALSQMSWLTEQLRAHVVVKMIDPETSKEYGAYRREQSALDGGVGRRAFPRAVALG